MVSHSLNNRLVRVATALTRCFDILGVSGARVHKFNNTEDLTKYKADYDKKWPTGFFTQFTVLCRR